MRNFNLFNHSSGQGESKLSPSCLLLNPYFTLTRLLPDSVSILSRQSLLPILLLCLTLFVGVGQMWAEHVISAQNYAFDASTTPSGWNVSSSNTHANKYLKFSPGDYVQMTTADVFASGERLTSNTMDVEVSCGTFGNWEGTKSVTVTVELRKSDGTVLSTANTTFSELTGSEGAYKNAISVSKPSNPAQIAYLRVTFAGFNNYDVLRVKNVRLSYTTDIPCDNSLTIQKGTGTNCNFSLGTIGTYASCNAVSTTVTINPTAGYGTPVVSQEGASAAPNVTGSGNSQTVTYAANTTGTSTINVTCSANDYTITLNNQSATTAGTASITATYNSSNNLTSAIDKPERTGWVFGGYYTAVAGGGTQIIDADGNIIAGVSTYTDENKKWIKAGGVTLYAKWTCTVTWSVTNLTNVYATQTVTYNPDGCKVSSVPAPNPKDYCSNSNKFMGWSQHNAGAEYKTESYYDDLFTNVAGSPDLKNIGSVTFYAVFADYAE